MHKSSVSLAKLAVASSIGTTMEWYDIFIAAFVATSVWPQLFFPKDAASIGMALSVLTFFVVYFTRPVGAFVFGHFGDRLGRKPMLTWTLLLLGTGSLGISIVPVYNGLGLLAPIFLISFRALQGVGLGGEFGGAITWVLESTEGNKSRAFWTSIVQSTPFLGMAAAATAIVSLSTMPHNEFIQYGWRIPFLIGAIMVVIGAVIRYRFDDSQLFTKTKLNGVEHFPSLTVLRHHYKKILVLIPVIFPTIAFDLIPVLPFSLTFLSGLKVNLAFTETGIAIGAIVCAMVTVASSTLGDRIGRRKVLILGNIAILAITYPFFLLLNTGNEVLIILAYVLGLGLSGISYSVIGAFLGEQFKTKYRYSGTGLSYHLASLVIGILAGVFVPWFVVYSSGAVNAWPLVATIMIILSILSVIAAYFTKETQKVILETES